jgi:tetratricopeptide (TPR) repeat protein
MCIMDGILVRIRLACSINYSFNSMNYNSLPRSPVAVKPFQGLLVAAVVVCLALAATLVRAQPAPADDFKEASKLYQSGKLDQAMSKVNSGLQRQPKDAQGRFLKGLIQTEQKKTADAIATFTGLTEDYPELPEPYNNLAVLYASQGNYDKAKAALELAIHTHPAYATAHENLGDIYAQLARRAYDKALQLDKSNAAAQSKLAMVKEMFSVPKSATAGSATPTQVAKADPAKADPVKADPAKPAADPAKPRAPAVATAPAASAASEDGVKASVNAWARAWAAKDVPAYLGYYATTFVPPDGLDRGAWEAQRRERIERPKSITIELTFRSVKINGNEATAVFKQSYRSETVNSNNTKTLKLVRAGDKWLIQSERAGG